MAEATTHCNSYLSTTACRNCNSLTRFLHGKEVKCNNCGTITRESAESLKHGGRFCTCDEDEDELQDHVPNGA